jgi:hypothetical protein
MHVLLIPPPTHLLIQVIVLIDGRLDAVSLATLLLGLQPGLEAAVVISRLGHPGRSGTLPGA